MSDVSDRVHLPKLLSIGYRGLDPAQARMAIARGTVMVNGRVIDMTETDMPRESLRNAVIHCGRHEPLVIDEEGRKIKRFKGTM